MRAIGICPGSGGGAFGQLRDDDVDLLLTGELSHHEALAATERGRAVLALFHSNSERGFLGQVVREQLLEAVREEWARASGEEGTGGVDPEVHVSEADRDPYGILIAG